MSGMFSSDMWQDGRLRGWRREGAAEAVGEWWIGERFLGTGWRRWPRRLTSRAAVAAWEWRKPHFSGFQARRMAVRMGGAAPESGLMLMGTGRVMRPRGWTREGASAAVASVEAQRPRGRAGGAPRMSMSLVNCAPLGTLG